MLNDTSCQEYQDLRTPHAVLEIESCTVPLCDTLYSGLCYSAVTDTATNPYRYGIAGNWRPNRSLVYYGQRAETDAGQPTNIRTNGTIASFVPFWTFAANGVVPRYDSTRWVWNSESTLFNKKGYELENKDPLGRYNAGLYGYDHTLPTAVAQNSRYREAAFEGFEDYLMGAASCDSACPVQRHFDLTALRPGLDSTQSHTGKYSLRVGAGAAAGFSASVAAADSTAFSLSFNTAPDNCTSTPTLKTIATDSRVLLPNFSPLAGKQMLFSAWVKEEQECACEQYTGNRVVIVINTASGDVVITAKPSGNIIEGWQRYEQVIELPPGATTLTLSLESTGNAVVFFDDVRLHPYSANMKSFVYDAVSLRLMAELDENNYASFYEYDDDGTLIRVKKETARGIKTIKETRSALLKEPLQ